MFEKLYIIFSKDLRLIEMLKENVYYCHMIGLYVIIIFYYMIVAYTYYIKFISIYTGNSLNPTMAIYLNDTPLN